MTKIWKNLMGNNSKIHVDEIATISDGELILLSTLINGEFGSNENGRYLRLPNGIQFCWNKMRINYNAGTRLAGYWTFPAEFIKTDVVLATRDSYHADERIRTASYTAGGEGGTQALVRGFSQKDISFQQGDSTLVDLFAAGIWKI